MAYEAVATISATVIQSITNFSQYATSSFGEMIPIIFSIIITVSIVYFMIKNFRRLAELDEYSNQGYDDYLSNEQRRENIDRQFTENSINSDVMLAQKHVEEATERMRINPTNENLTNLSFAKNDFNNFRQLQASTGGLRDHLMQRYTTGNFKHTYKN